MKTVNGIFGFGVALILFFSVAPATHGFMAFQHHGKYGDANVLIRHLDKEEWQIGYRFYPTCPAKFRKAENELKEIITESLRVWLQPLRDTFPDVAITNKFNVKLLEDYRVGEREGELDEQVAAAIVQIYKNLDTRITFTCDQSGWATAGIGDWPPDINIRGVHFLAIEGAGMHPRHPHGIHQGVVADLMHELGHAFGLDDTYAKGSRTSTGGLRATQGLQPSSIMDSSSGVHPPRFLPNLTEDDEKGIIWLYKHIYEGQPLDDCFFPEYVFQEKPAGCRPKQLLIFETKYGSALMTRMTIRDDPTLDVNEQDENGLTALHYTLLLKKFGAAELLIKHPNIDLSLRDKQGRTALDIAKQEEVGDYLVELLIAHQEKLSVDPQGKTIAVTWGELKRGN